MWLIRRLVVCGLLLVETYSLVLQCPGVRPSGNHVLWPHRRMSTTALRAADDKGGSFHAKNIDLVASNAKRLKQDGGSLLKAADNPSATIGEVDKASRKGAMPTYIQILLFVLPTTFLWLETPVMSLIDSSVIGRQSSLELAALGPATAVCDSLIYAFGFLAVATTNLQAAALAKADEDESRRESQKIVSSALAIACGCGLFVLVTVQVLCPWLLRIATNGVNTAVIPAATRYTRLRILGAPACIAAMVAQAACLGNRDPWTPLMIGLVACAFNAVMDVFLAVNMRMGIGGAAIGTAAAETLSLCLLVRALIRTQGPRVEPFIKIPSYKELSKFVSFAGPIFFALLGEVICYTYMTIVATTCGNVSLATHTVMLRLFFLGTTVGDSLSQTAQAFLPSILARDKADRKKMRSTIRQRKEKSQSQPSGGTDSSGAEEAADVALLNEEAQAEGKVSVVEDILAATAATAVPSTSSSTLRIITSLTPTSTLASSLDDVNVRKPHRKLPRSGQRLIWRLLRLGLVVGLANGSVSQLIPVQFPHIFTSDMSIVKEMAVIAPLLFWALLGHSSVMALEGILFAKRQLVFLAAAYGLNTAWMVGALHWVMKHGGGGRGGLIMVWKLLPLYQLARFVQYFAWVLIVRKRENNRFRATIRSAAGATKPTSTPSSTSSSTKGPASE